MTKAREIAATPETVLASGIFTTAATLNISNILSDTYKYYTLNFNYIGSASGNEVDIQFRENTTDKTTGYYAGGVLANTGGTVASRGQRSNGANFYVGETNNVFPCASTVTIYRPSASSGLITSQHYNYYGDYSLHYGGANQVMTNFNGLRIYVSSGTITGYYILTGKRV